MFVLRLIVAGTLLHAYVFWRASSVPFFARRFSRRAILGLGVALWGCLALSLHLGHGAAGWPARVLEMFGMTWLAVLFLTFLALLAADVVTGFGLLFRRSAPRVRGWALGLAVVLSVVALVQGLRPPVVRDYEVRMGGLPADADGTVVVALSDLHLGSVLGKRWLAARVAQVRSLRPDVVVLLGDLLEGHGGREEELMTGLRSLSAPLGVWAVAGNHESHRRRGGTQSLEDAGFGVLRDRWAEVRPGLVLAGVDDLTSRHEDGEGAEPIRRALADRPPGAAILLSHTPWYAESAAAFGAGLMLSGHTHGGQLWPFGLLESGVYPLLAGRYEVGGMPVIVSRGTGTWGPRMRLWEPSEIVRVTLRAALPVRPVWEVYAIRYATLLGFSAADLVAGADAARRLDIAMAVWLLKGPGGRNVLVDTGFHRDGLFKQWRVEGFTSPAEMLARVGVRAADVSDVILTHLHWDHAGGVDLFPEAHVWVQRAEWAVASDAAARPAGVTATDVAVLRARERAERLTVVDGDWREVIPGITVYVGGRHTPGSQYVGVATRSGTVVLASDAVYLYENLEKGLPIAQTLDPAANLEAQRRMRGIASRLGLIVPGHDPEVFRRFPAPGNGVARID